ncbi:hypothetical protein B7P43_G13958 [Cryptotermes secundus]|uniref:C2H2-type domain-containing protein n=1 Tax=Cryptotermes secundus TaxID=105785 RepID=A0A2J7Q1Q7_9NEOP|nr:hypothetical protein B7P43_G13958 [Cryptotermes secundus]
MNVKKCLNVSPSSRLSSRYRKGDYGSACEYGPMEQDSDPEVNGDTDSNSFVLSCTKVKEEDDNSMEGTAAKNNRECDERHGIVTINTKQGPLIVKSEKAEDDSPVSCLVCGGTVINLNQCLIHALRAHANSETRSYPCSLCEMSFSVDTDLTRHYMNIHQNIKDARLLHVCIICGRHCASQRALKSHVCIPMNSVPDQLACKTCGQSFSTKERLVFHRQFHDPDARSLECVPCGMVFTEEDNLYDHVRFTHRGQSFICNECGGHFNSRAALRGHLRSHRKLRHHKCEVCNKTFLDKQTLNEHSVSHMEVKPYQCHICGKYLNRNSRLKKHLMSHELQKTTDPQECFQCTVCGETFPNEPKAVAHAQIGHSLPSESECVFHLYPMDKVYRCEFCERIYADPAFLSAHRSSHTDESFPFKCHICGAGFATFARVATHKVTHGIYDKKDEFSIPKFYLCDSCDKAYIHWTYLSVHRKMVHAEVKHMYKCKMCPEQFVNSWSLAYHRKTRHCETEPPPLDSSLPANERKRWKCECCEKRYLSLDSHKKTHNGIKPHVCPVCKKTFVHISSLSSHLRLHRGDKPHSCEYCGKTFLQRGDRDDHVRKHTGERPFSCQQCPKSFRTRAMWFEHTRIHRDERPFPCDICGASFRRSYSLKNHKTTHSGERPHVCQICNKTFRQKQHMQKHVRNYHQEEMKEQEPSDDVITFILPTD